MKPNRRIRSYGSPVPGWRRYQDELRPPGRKRRRPRIRLLRGFGLVCVFLAALYGVRESPLDSAVFAPSPRMERSESALAPIRLPGARPLPDDPGPPPPEPARLIDQSDVQALLEADRFVNLTDPVFDFEFDGRRFRVETSLDEHLQRRMLAILRPETARYLGAVVLDPDTGRVLAMVSYDSVDPGHNTCLDSLFPAASVFKIVTAAAAIEECRLGSESALSYAGGKYTLYKYQVRKSPGRKLHQITLRNSFAQSVNPVFGRLGAFRLGKNSLARHAEAFGFNRPIPFEIPVETSPLRLSDDPYQWAEVASGFNRTTLLSPLHGAMMAAAVASGDGRLVAPTIVERIRDENGRLLYRSPDAPRALSRAMVPEAVRDVRRLMAETVRTGTARRSFLGFEDDPVLGRLDIGGKTGTMGSRIHPGRLYDWFVGYAAEKKGTRRIAVAIAVAHEERIGTKAKRYARSVIETYFQHQFARNEDAEETARGG